MRILIVLACCGTLAACGVAEKTADTVNTGAKTASTVAIIGAVAAGAATVAGAAVGG